MAKCELSLVVLLVLLSWCSSQELPDIWTVVEDSYETEVLVTFDKVDDGTTMYVKEYYEIAEQKGVLHMDDHDNHQKVNYFIKSNQMFIEFGDRQCDVGNLEDHPGYNMWGWNFKTGAENENFIYGPSAILRIPKNHPGKFINKAEIRGTEVNMFTVTMENYTIDYFFAVDEWDMPYGHVLDGKKMKSPLQVMVHGVQCNPWSKDQQDFINMTVIYDYVAFRPRLKTDDETFWTFTLDDGLECKERIALEPDKGVPQMPFYFRSSLEIVVPTPELTEVSKSKIYYDFYRKIARVDHNEVDEIGHGIPTKEIHDFNTGIYYSINSLSGECKMGPIGPNQFGNAIGSSVIGNVVMGNPQNIFHLDDTYVFSGTLDMEGIVVDRFTSVRDDISNGNGGKYKKVVIDFEFTAEIVLHPGAEPGHSGPERMVVTIFNDDDPTQVVSQEVLYFLAFSSHLRDEEIDDFDIRDCFNTPQQRNWLKIFFEGDFDQGMNQHEDEFKQMLIEKITTESKISPVRIAEINIDHDEAYTYVLMLLLQPAPFLLQFTPMEDHKPTTDEYRYPLNINDDESCAEQCLRYTKFQCESFYECVSVGWGCYLSNYGEPHGGGDADVPNLCTHYKKDMINNTLPIQDTNKLFEAWLTEEILRDRLNFDLTHTDENGTVTLTTYKGKGYEEELLDDDPIFVDLLKGDFTPVYMGGKMKYNFVDYRPLRSSYIKCMAGCDEMKSFRCESFSFCYNDNSCLLSATTFNRQLADEDVVLQTDCNTLTRRHLDDYLEFDGLVSITDVKQEIDMVEDPNQCALYCDQMTDFVCRSFDYCKDHLVCYLHTTRALEPGDSSLANATECNHFSRSYLVDFEKHENVIVDGNRDHYFTDMSVSACARACEDEPNYNCLGFDFCNDVESVTCYLSEAYYSDEGVDVVDEPNCDHYSREYYDGKSRPPPRTNSKPYNSGDMAALGICMLIIAIAGTFGGVYVYNKFFKHK